MKKSLLTLLGVGLLLTSCQSDEPFAPVEGGEKQVTFTLTAPDAVGTRANGEAGSDQGGIANNPGDTIYYSLELYYQGVKQGETMKTTATGKQATFSPTVILGRNYEVVAYANLKSEQNNLKNITVATGINDEKNDAYFATVPVQFTENELSKEITLKRPFGKLRLVATDYDATKTAITNIEVTYAAAHQNLFDAQAAAGTGVYGVFTGNDNTVKYTATHNPAYYADATGKTIFVDYIAAPAENETLVKFNIKVDYATGGESFTRTFTKDIPVRRNALTTLSGNFFTANSKITVKVDENFDDSKAENRTLVSSASQLQEAINNATPGETTEIILGGDIHLTQPIVFGEVPVSPAPAPTRSGEAPVGSFILDLNGKDISYPNGYAIENYSAELTISGNGRLGSDGLGGIRSHGGKIVINDGTFTGSSDWNKGTYQHILKAVNTEVEINGGTFDATIGGMTNAMINVSENSIVTINGGKFKNVNGVIPQFAPYMFTYEKNGKLIINDGNFYGGWRFNGETATTDIYGGNFTVSYDGQSFHANSTHVLKIYGGTFSLENGGKLNPTNHVAEGYRAVEENGLYNVGLIPAAKVGNTEYGSIDEAIAAWKNNTTLTLLKDVTLNEVVTLKSTEHHILDLSKYTMTAASGQNAFVIQACGTGDAERNAITIKADANNPGGINAGNKCIVYYKYADGGISGNDRPIIKIEGGVFTGSTSSWGTAGIYTIGTAARKCATLNISGGTFNCTINGSSKSKLLISGGTFNYSVGSQGDSTALRLIWGGKFKTLGFMTADDNNTKFWIGTEMAKSDVGVYVDKDGYLVVGGPVITENDGRFSEKKDYTSWSSYLKYSSAKTYGLFYE